MIQFVYQVLRTYAPILTLPVAVVVGTIGYMVESSIKRAETPNFESIEEMRRHRQMERGTILISPEFSADPSTFVPKTIFNINQSPSLNPKTDK